MLDQSVSVIVSKDLEATSLWYIDSNSKWVILSDAATDVDATTEKFSYVVPSDLPIMGPGKMILAGGELAQATVDAAVVV